MLSLHRNGCEPFEASVSAPKGRINTGHDRRRPDCGRGFFHSPAIPDFAGQGDIAMGRGSFRYGLMLAALLISIGATKPADFSFITERIQYASDMEGFKEVFPVTENLNNIMAQISRAEIEKGRGVPNFLVYPYETGTPNTAPFALIWEAGEYARKDEVPPNQQAFLIYDPRRLSAGNLETEEGQSVEYRHFIVRCGINHPPENDEDPVKLTAPLEPTERSLYISRGVIPKSDKPEARRRAVPTLQKIFFPRITIPEKVKGQTVHLLALQVESALQGSADIQPEPDEAYTAGNTAALDRSFIRVREAL